MDEYKSRLSTYLSDMVREELEKYDGGFTDEWNDQRKKNAEVLGYKLSGKSDIKEGATEFWQDMFKPGNIPNQYISQLIKKKGELPSKKHIKQIYRDNGNPSSSQLAKAFKQLSKEKYIKKQGSMWKWESGFAWRTGTELESVNEKRIKNSPLRRNITSTFKDLDKKFRKKLTSYDIDSVASYITSKNRYFPKELANVAAEYFYEYKRRKLKINQAIQATINYQRGYPYKSYRTGTELESVQEMTSRTKRDMENSFETSEDLDDFITKHQDSIPKSQWRKIDNYLDDIRDEEQGMKSSGWADPAKKGLKKILMRHIKESISVVNEELQNSQGEQTDFKKGDLVKDINPDCPHHGSEGEVTKVGKGTITFNVSNNGKNYQQGDELEKTVDQMVKLKESVNEGFTKYHIRLTDTPGWYGVWDKKGKQKFEGDKRFVMKNLKKLKTRMGNFQLKSLIGVATKRKGKDIEFDVVESVNEYHKFRGKMTYGDKGIGEKGMYFFVDQLINAMEDVDEREFVSHMSKELGVDKKVMGRIWKNYDKVHPSLRYKWRPRQWEKWLNKQGITEDKKRDYKAEYKKFQSSTKAKKYRAELNQYNRKKGTYGNNDGKDASHKGGKIVGFEKESTNRGRREKSRLKKEDIREFSGEQGINVYLGGIVDAMRKAGLKAKTAKQMKHGFSKSRDKIGFFIEVEQRSFGEKEMYTLQVEIDRDGNLWYLSAHKPIKLGKWADTSKVVRVWKTLNKVRGFGQSGIFKKR